MNPMSAYHTAVTVLNNTRGPSSDKQVLYAFRSMLEGNKVQDWQRSLCRIQGSIFWHGQFVHA